MLRLGLFLGDGAVNGAFYPLEGLGKNMSAVAAKGGRDQGRGRARDIQLTWNMVNSRQVVA